MSGLAVVVAALALATPASAQAETIYGLLGTASPQSLVTFDSATPATTTPVGTITGLQAGEVLAGIDIRPATGELYGVTLSSRLYRIDRTTATATQVGSGQFNPPFNATRYGVDFSPVSDILRAVGFSSQNLRIDPNTAGVISDNTLNPATSAVGLAYDANVPGSPSTTAYVYSFSDNLYTLGSPGGSPISPNSGQVFVIGASGVSTGSPAATGLDISPFGTAYMSADVLGVRSLYSVNLGTGAVTLIGATSPTQSDIAVAPLSQSLAFDAAAFSAGEGAGAATVTISRSQSLGAASVRLLTTGGTATPGDDYQPVDTRVEFAAGQGSQQATIPLVDNAKVDGPRTIDLAISEPAGGDATLGSPSTATVTIADNDDVTPPTVALGHLPRQITIDRLLHKGLKVTVTASETSALTFSLLGKPLRSSRSARAFSSTLATVSLPFGDGKRSAKLKPKRAKLRRVQKRSLKVSVVATDAAGNSGSTLKTIKIKRPRD